MAVYLARRALLVIPLLWAVVTLVFIVVHLVPGDPAAVLLGPFATGAREAILRRQWGLDNPLYVQYGQYLLNAISGHFGTSFLTGIPAVQEIEALFPYSFVLAVLAMVIAVCFGTLLGIVAATHQGSWIDYLALVVSLVFISSPDFFLGLLLLLVFSGDLGWFPSIGAGSFQNVGDLLMHAILPAIALSAGLLAYVTRMTRTSLLGALREDFIRTARAKGLGRRLIVYKHALRNALVPVLSIVGVAAGQVVGGTVVIETVFARPGIGKLLVDSITGRDYIQVQACVIILAAIFVIVNLMVDMCYALIDPRIQYS